MKAYHDPDNGESPRPGQSAAMPVALPTQMPAGIPTEDSPDAAEELPPIMDDQGAFTPEWYTRFAELEPYAATLAKFHRPEALAKSYANLERLKGYPSREDARRMAAFRSVVGLPETEEEFSIPRPENMPAEVWDDAMAAQLAHVAYEYGVPAPAMQALSESYAGETRRLLEAYRLGEQKAIEQADASLQEEWGRHYDANMNAVADFLDKLGRHADVDVARLVENPALRANPDFAKLMLAASAMLEEAPMRQGTPSNNKDEAHRIAHDPTHPLHEAYMRTNHPQHRYANEQYDRLAFGRTL